MLKRFIICSLLFLTGYCCRAQVTFVVESLPAATPVADTVFLCGTFNDWTTHDLRYALQRQLNGQLAITVSLPSGKHEYKFTRGNWTKVETSSENSYNKNRVIVLNDKPQTVFVRIDNWLDLGGARPLNYLIFYFFACAFQCLALCLLVYRIQKRDQEKYFSFTIVNVVFTVLLFLLVLLEIVDQIWQTYFSFVFQVVFFCWSPLLLFFFHSFNGKKLRHLYLYFIPALIAALLVLVRFFNVKTFGFLSDVIWPPVTWGNLVFTGAALLVNLLLYLRIFRDFPFLHPHATEEREPHESLLYYFYWTSLVALLFVPMQLTLVVNGWHHPAFEDFHVTAIFLSLLIFIETYYLWRYPEIMKEGRVPATADYSPDLLEKLNALMLEGKPYKNPDLSISDLADMLGTKPHALSRVINDAHEKNFRDFLNKYRIEEFIALANTKEYKHYTFLALAQEVGFNSKSTFNLAFKKLTNQSPREYFKSRE